LQQRNDILSLLDPELPDTQQTMSIALIKKNKACPQGKDALH
jgi:hypothetical protein